MTASVVLVLAAMTVTGISVYRNHQKSQEEEQHVVDFSKLEEETQSPVAQAQNQSAQNVTGSEKDSGELDYDPYYAQTDSVRLQTMRSRSVILQETSRTAKVPSCRMDRSLR